MHRFKYLKDSIIHSFQPPMLKTIFLFWFIISFYIVFLQIISLPIFLGKLLSCKKIHYYIKWKK